MVTTLEQRFPGQCSMQVRVLLKYKSCYLETFLLVYFSLFIVLPRRTNKISVVLFASREIQILNLALIPLDFARAPFE